MSGSTNTATMPAAEASAPDAIDAMIRRTTPRAVALDDLVLDASMQCRAGGVVPAVVSEYAEALREGVEFPPIQAIQVDGTLYVVDGWHRYAAAGQAGRKTIQVYVKEGTRRDALLEAVKANSDHGLQRTQEDKRKAVRLLLMDAEWCKLSSRELAGLVAVSHTFVDQMRRAYSTAKGEVLTDARASHVDGEPPQAWRELAAKCESWQRAEVERIRTAPDPLALARLDATQSAYKGIVEAWLYRREELATEEAWPWPEDMTAEEMTARLQALDTEADIAAAACSKCLTVEERATLYGLLKELYLLPQRGWEFSAVRTAFAGRPALLDRVDAREAEHRRQEEARAAAAAARETKDPYELARRVHLLKEDPVKQGWAFRDAAREVREKLRPSELHPSIRDGAYRDWVDPEHQAATCVVPDCAGWVADDRCIWCGTYQVQWKNHVERMLRLSAELLPHPGFGVRVPTDRGSIDLNQDQLTFLGELHAMTRDERSIGLHTWMKKAPGGLARLWSQACMGRDLETEIVFVDATKGGEVADG